MISLTNIWQSMQRHFAAVAKARVQSTLLTMGPEWVERYGYSYQSLRNGIDAWPWRQTPEKAAEEKEIRRAIRELSHMSDRELRDLGIARSGIESAVRNGHPDRGFRLADRDQAA